MRSSRPFPVPSLLLSLALAAGSLQAQPSADGLIAVSDCGTALDILPRGGEVYAVGLDSVPRTDNWLVNCSAKGGPIVGVHIYPTDPSRYWLPYNWLSSRTSPVVVSVFATFPDGLLHVDSGFLGVGPASTGLALRVGDSPARLPGHAGIVLPNGPGGYHADLGTGPEQFPRERDDGVELAFALVPELSDQELGGCTYGGGEPSPSSGSGLIIGYNIFRSEDSGLVPTQGELGQHGNWLDYAPLDPTLDSSSLLSRVVDPDGLPATGDEVLIYHDAPFHPDGSPRAHGAAPVLDSGTGYWYAVQPVLQGDLDEWSSITLSDGSPSGDLRADLDGDGIFDAVEFDPGAGNGPEFLSPQARVGIEGLGLTVEGRALLSGLVHGGPDGSCPVAMQRLDRSSVCLGQELTIDASESGLGACAGSLEYQFESPLGSVLPGGSFSADPRHVFRPDSIGEHVVHARVRCAADPSCEASTPGVRVPVRATDALVFSSDIEVVTPRDCVVIVSWDLADGGDVAAYDLYRGEAGAPVPIDAAHLIASGPRLTSFVDRGWLGPVSYRVVAWNACQRILNGGGDAAPIEALDGDPPQFPGLSAPRDRGACEVEITWDDSRAFDTCSGLAFFNVYRDHDVRQRGETLVASGLSGSPYIDTPPGNAVWHYLVRAVDHAGNEDERLDSWLVAVTSCADDFPADADLGPAGGVERPSADAAGGGERTGGPRTPSGERIFSPDGERPHEPIRVVRAAGDMTIRWGPSPSEGGPYDVSYSVLRGSLAALSVGAYDHALVDEAACGLLAHEYLMAEQGGGSWYYLIATVSGANGTFGDDSEGSERPEAATCF